MADETNNADVGSPLWNMFIARLREFLREPEAVFWVYGFPLVMTVALGLAFRNKPPEPVNVDIEEGPGAEAIAKSLQDPNRFKVHVDAPAACALRLRTGKTPLVVRVEGSSLHYLYDPDRPDSMPARTAVDDALQRAAGRKDPRPIQESTVREPGGRYIDFLVPGLLGMGIMGGGLWGVGFVTVDMRLRKVLKRFLATPMSKRDFLTAIMLSRMVFLIPEVIVLLVFSYIVFGVRNFGTWPELLALILLGSLSFSGIGLLVASRAKTIEAVSGLMNLVMLPMWIFSGIFFSSERFPPEILPAIRLLPLTALLDALRGVMLDGATLLQLAPQVGTLIAWGGICFVVALKIFRWN